MKRLFLALFLVFALCGISQAAVVTEAYTTADDVTIDRLESNRQALTDAANSLDGSLVTAGSIQCAGLDDNSCPEKRWDEGFNDFVFSGLTIPTSASLSSTTASGIAYILGTRVVKDSTAKTYTASRHTYVDLSNNGTYTYSEVAINGSEPSTATNSIRLARVSTDSTTVLSVRDDRVTEISIAAGSAGSLADTDADTGIQTEESDDEDILRFDIGDTTLSSAREVLTIQAIDASDVKIEPTTDNDVDLGSESKQFRTIYITGTVSADDVEISERLTLGGDEGVAGQLLQSNGPGSLAGWAAQGDRGQVLTSAGSGANFTWTTPGIYWEPDPGIVLAYSYGSSDLTHENTAIVTSLSAGVLGKVSSLVYDFDGSADYIEIATPIKNYVGQSSITIEVWVYKEVSAEATPTILDGSTSSKLRLIMTDTQITGLIITSSGSESWAVNHGLSSNGDDQWTYIAVTFTTQGVADIYVNGVDIGDGNDGGNGTTLVTFGDILNIGASNAKGNLWKGKIDGLRISMRKIGATEILFRYTTSNKQ